MCEQKLIIIKLFNLFLLDIWVKQNYHILYILYIVLSIKQLKINTVIQNNILQNYITKKKMNKQKSITPCIYYDDSLNQNRFKFKMEDQNGYKPVNLLKKDKIKKSNYANQQYFPNYTIGVGDSSMQSSATAKIKDYTKSVSKGFRPKMKTRSENLSEKSTKKQLVNHISKLANQLQNKNKMLGKRLGVDKITQAQVMELYRAINYYQGKITQLQQQIKRYQQALQKIGRECDEKSKHKSQIQQMVLLCQQMRKQNAELNGKLQQKDYAIGHLQQQNHKIRIKVNFLSTKTSFLKKSFESSNGFKPNSISQDTRSKLYKQPTLNLKIKQQNYGNIQSKINKLQTTLNFLKKQNDNLFAQIQRKQEIILELEIKIAQYIEINKRLKQQQIQKGYKKLQETKKSQKDSLVKTGKQIPKQNKFEIKLKQMGGLRNVDTIKQLQLQNNSKASNGTINTTKYQKNNPLNKITLISRLQRKSDSIQNEASQIVGQQENHILKQSISESLQQCMQQIVGNSSKTTFISQAISKSNPKIFLKLKYHMQTQQTTYQQLINLLIDPQLLQQRLQQQPYSLKPQQSQQLINFLNSVRQQCKKQNYQIQQIIKEIMPKYKNITLRKQKNMKIQIANQMLNREQQFNSKLQQDTHPIQLLDLQNYLKEWGLHQVHIDTLCKQYYRETGQLGTTTLPQVKQIIDKWVV